MAFAFRTYYTDCNNKKYTDDDFFQWAENLPEDDLYEFSLAELRMDKIVKYLYDKGYILYDDEIDYKGESINVWFDKETYLREADNDINDLIWERYWLMFVKEKHIKKIIIEEIEFDSTQVKKVEKRR